ncbi:MAG TPA: sialate O-acetylesterase [Sedimentisphaerales bacterium]|nr:sialate O-acetylesterase [Sedimentisphaerales bacterium]
MNRKQMTLSGPNVLMLSLVVLLAGAGVTLADVRLPAIIGDNMVLQRGGPVSVWGWADPGEEIMVSVSWHGMSWAVTTGQNGKWAFKMNPPKAGGPYGITLRGKNEIEIKNVMVGEVWVCSGQSNMQFAVRQAVNGEQEVADADYPNIRLFTVERTVADQPQSDCKGNWTSCSPEAVPGFSAVGYFFGRELHKKLGVPVGLIHTSWGGTPAEAWTRRGMLKAEPDFSPILERYDDALSKYPQAKQEYERKLEDWKQAVEKAKTEGTRAPGRPREPLGAADPHSPSGLYNAMIAPLIPFSIQGAIWYQGESNASRAYQYRKLFPAMIKNWRDDWGQGDFPFLFVQLANFKEQKPDPGESDWAELREAQSMTLALPNAGMAVIIDIGEAKNIHPKNKQDVGKRLALWALANSYGQKIEYCGPVYKSSKTEGNRIILTFDHVGDGLVAAPEQPLKGFAIAGADREFVWADARIDGNTVVVSSDKVSGPVAVRYAWADNPVCNLYNKEGLPASPFRTDDWPGVTADNK